MGAKSKAKTHPPNTFFDPLSRSPRIRPQSPIRGQTWPKENLLRKNSKGVKNAEPQSYPKPAEKAVKKFTKESHKQNKFDENEKSAYFRIANNSPLMHPPPPNPP